MATKPKGFRKTSLGGSSGALGVLGSRTGSVERPSPIVSLSSQASGGGEAISSPPVRDCFPSLCSGQDVPSLAITSGEGVYVAVAVGVGDGVLVGIGVGVAVSVGVGDEVGLGVGVRVGACVGVGVVVGEGVTVLVLVGVAVGVEVGWSKPRAEGGPSSTKRRGLPPMKQPVGSLQSAPGRVRVYRPLSAATVLVSPFLFTKMACGAMACTETVCVMGERFQRTVVVLSPRSMVT